jgi:cation diffusion facilitator family transporter
MFGLSLGKAAAGWLTGSKALLADACHSAADFAGAAAAHWGGRQMKSGPLAAGGKTQAEAAASTLLSVVFLVGGLEMALSSLRTVAGGVYEAPGWGAVAMIAAGMAARELIALYRRKQNHRLGVRQDPLRGADPRSDIFASLTALVGTVGAMMGEWLDMPILYVLDPAAGIVISVFVLRMGYRMLVAAIRLSEVRAVNEWDAQSLLEAVQKIEGVVAVDELHAREHGHYVIVDVVIRVNPRITVYEGHDIAQRVRRQLTKRFLHVAEACVQVQPYDPGYPYKTNHVEEDMPTLLQ